MTLRHFTTSVLLIALLLTVGFVLTGCGCEHEWIDATCTTASCSKCQQMVPAGDNHMYVFGRCQACGAADPDYVPHTWW